MYHTFGAAGSSVTGKPAIASALSASSSLSFPNPEGFSNVPEASSDQVASGEPSGFGVVIQHLFPGLPDH